jgi:hypothetical protein
MRQFKYELAIALGLILCIVYIIKGIRANVYHQVVDDSGRINVSLHFFVCLLSCLENLLKFFSCTVKLECLEIQHLYA